MGIKRIGGGMAVNQITEGVIWKQLLYFFFPILFGTFFQQLLQHGGRRHRGAVRWHAGAGRRGRRYGPLINLFVNLFVGLASGTTVVIAQAYGAHDAESVGGTGAYLGGAGSGRGGLALRQPAWRPRPGR